MAKILLIDDDLQVLNLNTKLLETCGYEVTSINNPLKALELINKKSFDLIVSDFDMPDMNGLMLYKQINKPVNFIIMTGSIITNEFIVPTYTKGTSIRTIVELRLNASLDQQSA